MEKMTKREKWGVFKGVLAGEIELTAETKELLETFADAELALLDKKKGTATKAQKEALEIASRVYDIMDGIDDAMTVTALYGVEGMVEAGVKSPQHLSSLITKLKAGAVEGKKVYRKEVKKVAYFSTREFDEDSAEDAE